MNGSEPGPAEPSARTRRVAGLVHLLALGGGVPASVLAYAVADSAFVTENARHALNWQLSFLAGLLALGVGALVTNAAAVLLSNLLLFGLLAFAALGGLASVAVHLVAAHRAVSGRAWRYPVPVEVV